MDFSPFFVCDDSFAQLNAGTRTRVPLEVLRWMSAETLESERNPTRAMFTGYDRVWAVQKRLAAFLGASPHDLFLRANVTAAFNDFLFALPALPPGELLTTSFDYGGTIGLARHWASRRGLGFRVIPLDALRSPFRADAILSELRPETRVLLLSHVATANGAVLPLPEILAGARRRDVIVLVDGAHAVGAEPLDLRELDDADFYGGNFHKWFLGPEGTGFGWIHPRWKERLCWSFGGWASEAPPGFYQGFGDRDPESCRRFFPGTIDRVPFLALERVLEFRERHGTDAIRLRQLALRDFAAAELQRRLGWERLSPEVNGPLLAYRRPEGWSGESAALATRILLEAGVQLALPAVNGTALVRFSPGVYAREEEISSGIERLARWRP